MPCPHFPVTLSHLDHQKTVEEAKKIVLQLRPHWQEQLVDEKGQDALKCEFFTEGITNTILSIWNSIVGRNDRILIRIYGEKTELLVDREVEIRNMVFLNRHGCAAPLYGTFDNGVIYGYVPGRVLKRSDVREPHLAELIAKRMAKMHNIGLDKSAETNPLMDGDEMSQEPVLISKIEWYINNLPTTFDEPEKQQKFLAQYPTKEQLLKELALVQEKVQEMQSPVVFCHNDLLVKNLVYDKEKDVINFIDYEYAAYNYQAFDIANHFCEYAGVDDMDFSLYPDEKYQKWWVANYLKYWRQFTNGPAPTEHDVDVLFIQVNVFAATSHFWWSIWGIIQARYSTIDYDFLQYGIDRMKEYKRLKDRTWGWKIPE